MDYWYKCKTIIGKLLIVQKKNKICRVDILKDKEEQELEENNNF